MAATRKIKDVVKEYRWTLTDLNKSTSLPDTPFIEIKGYNVTESSIKTQLEFYGKGLYDLVSNSLDDPMSPYKELFPKDNPSPFGYKFPYFSDVNFEVNSPTWASLDIVEGVNKAGEALGGFLFGDAGRQAASSLLKGAGTVGMGFLAATNPKVGIFDRPKLWSNHEYRTINIKFSLFNTYDPQDWEKNRELCYELVKENLYLKQNFITGVPPVFYDVLIPGQYYSYASAVTNLTVFNRGNMRLLKDKTGLTCNVPDAYEVSMQLTDLVMPSQNLMSQMEIETRKVTVTVL